MPTRASAFPGFPRQMPAFFRGLERNNDRDWFAPRKAIFEEHVRGPMVELVTLVNDAIREFAPLNAVESPARAIYRIYRDTRFSKDKTPYKTHIGATFPRTGLPKHGGAGFYFGVSHKSVEIAGGVYAPEKQQLVALRNAIAGAPDAFRKLARNPRLVRSMGPLTGQSLARVPKGYDPDSPAAEALRLKQLYWFAELPASVALATRIRGEVVRRFRLMADAMEWMNQAILAARAAEGDEGRPVRPEPMF